MEIDEDEAQGWEDIDPNADSEDEDNGDDFLVNVVDDDMEVDRGDKPPAPSSKRVLLEEVPDEGDLVVEEYPGPAGHIHGHAKTFFEEWQSKQRHGEIGEHGPFESEGEMEFGTWLVTSGVSQGKTDDLLKMPYVSDDLLRQEGLGLIVNAQTPQIRDGLQPSFKNNRELLQKVDQLPQFPGRGWVNDIIEVQGDVKTETGDLATEELELRYKDPVDLVKEIFGNPAFKEHLRYAPEKLFTSEEKDDQIFNEMWTAEDWWETQVG